MRALMFHVEHCAGLCTSHIQPEFNVSRGTLTGGRCAWDARVQAAAFTFHWNIGGWKEPVRMIHGPETGSTLKNRKSTCNEMYACERKIKSYTDLSVASKILNGFLAAAALHFQRP